MTWNVQYNLQYNPLWNLFTRHTPVGNLALYVFRVRLAGTFHLSIRKEMARHVGNRIASSCSPSGFSSSGRHHGSDIHSIGAHTLVHARLSCYRRFDEHLILCPELADVSNAVCPTLLFQFVSWLSTLPVDERHCIYIAT